MDNNTIMERLLEVLNRIDGRLQVIEAKFPVTEGIAVRSESGDGRLGEISATAGEEETYERDGDSDRSGGESCKIAEVKLKERHEDSDDTDGGDRDSREAGSEEVDQPERLAVKEKHEDGISTDGGDQDSRETNSEGVDQSERLVARESDVPSYSETAYRLSHFKTFIWNEIGAESLGDGIGPGIEDACAKSFKDLCLIPPDGRLDLSFQKHVFESIPREIATVVARDLNTWFEGFHCTGGMRIIDINDRGQYVEYSSSPRGKSRPGRLLEVAETSGYYSTAPWSRIIYMEGMMSVEVKSQDPLFAPSLRNRDDMSKSIIKSVLPSAKAPFLIASLVDGGFDDYRSDLIKSAVDLHVQAEFARPEEDIFRNESMTGMTLHLVFYAISNERTTGRETEWQTGKLYDDDRFISKQAYTICIVRSGPFDGKHKFYTMLVLAPLQARLPTEGDLPEDTLASSISSMMYYGLQSYIYVLEESEKFAEYFDKLLGNNKAFLSPDEHDNLLVDDETFSRSRRYFWALSCLSELITCLKDAIEQWEVTRTSWNKQIRWLDYAEEEDCDWHIKRINHYSSKLEQICLRFEKHIKTVTSLRDALFNASAVMESRASTRLGENVKLLTFVSIFFLPLAYCTSLWSINTELFPGSVFIYVSILVAFATYMIVFNINSVVRLSTTVFQSYRKHLVSRMKSEAGSEYWSAKGDVFHAFEYHPKSEMVKPSDWLLVFYGVKCVFGAASNGLLKLARLCWQPRNANSSRRSRGMSDQPDV